MAVAAFLGGRIGFLAIAEVVERTLSEMGSGELDGLDDVHSCDGQARQAARRHLAKARQAN
jgi:1-deoxy-D-xylulose-5-phosphate reductoisomerase